MKLVDTNVFVYAAGQAHAYRNPCRTIVHQIVQSEIDVNTDVEALQEILHLYQARRDPETGIRMVRDVMRMLPVPLLVTRETVTTAIDLLVGYPQLQSRDAIHAAVVFEHGLEGIISSDRGFDIIEGLKRFDPKELAA